METDFPIFILQLFNLLICNFDIKLFIASVLYGINFPPPSSVFHALPIFSIGLCVYSVFPPLYLFRRLLFLFRRFVLQFLIWCTIFIAITSLSFYATRVVSNKHINFIRIWIRIRIQIVLKDIDPNTNLFVVHSWACQGVTGRMIPRVWPVPFIYVMQNSNVSHVVLLPLLIIIINLEHEISLCLISKINCCNMTFVELATRASIPPIIRNPNPETYWRRGPFLINGDGSL